MTRCILHEKNLLKTFWAEATITTMFVQNRLLSRAMKDKTPYEAWYGHKPLLQLLRILVVCVSLMATCSKGKN